MRVVKVVKQAVVVFVATTFLAGIAPAVARAEPADVVLYELSEFMQIVKRGPRESRKAIAGLSGFAALGTPLCPSEAVVYRNGQCYVNALGRDSVSTATGKGPLDGEFVVVVQGDNPADGPEYGVMEGAFSGEMDLSTATLTGLGKIAGTMQSGRRSFRFEGVVRLPFECAPGVACYATSGRDGVPTGAVPLDPLEYVLGAGMVRMDIWFE
jgi:hypothetical protein